MTRVLSKVSMLFWFCVFGLAHQGVRAQIDGAFIQKSVPDRPAVTANTVPDYDSDYAAAARLSGAAGSTPEADARPGEYYFIKAADAFRNKDYTFAIQMYEVSASWAYKPAEYNLGVMYARGQGIPMDLPRGMAWMALAAERNEKHYVDAREAVYAAMTKEQFEQANVIWRELRTSYGDVVALPRAKARWAQVRAGMTGSRVGSAAGNLIVSSLPTPDSGNPAGPIVRGPPTPRNKAARAAVIKATFGADVVGSQTVDGTEAYGQLGKSDNPYDPKFDRPALGTATVGPLEPAEEAPKKK
jgi:hypothetical protein